MSTHLVLNHHPHRFPATSSLSSLPHHYASSSSSHLFDYNPMSYQFDPSRSYPHTFNALPSNSVGDGYVGMLSVSNNQYTANYNLPSTLASPQIAAPQPVRSSHNLSAGSWGPGNTPSPVSSANSPTPTNSTLNYASGQSMRSPSPTAESPLGVNYPYGREEHLPGMPQPKSNRRPHIRSESSDKVLRCDKCPCRFARKYDLIRHERTHSLEAPYLCRGCARSYRRSDARKRHWEKLPQCLESHLEAVRNQPLEFEQVVYP